MDGVGSKDITQEDTNDILRWEFLVLLASRSKQFSERLVSSGFTNQLLLAVLDVRRPERQKVAFHVLESIVHQVDSVNNVLRQVLPSHFLDAMLGGDFHSYSTDDLRLARLALRNLDSDHYSVRELVISQLALCRQMEELFDSPTESPRKPSGTFLTDVNEQVEECRDTEKVVTDVECIADAVDNGCKTSLALADYQIPPLDDDFYDGDGVMTFVFDPADPDADSESMVFRQFANATAVRRRHLHPDRFDDTNANKISLDVDRAKNKFLREMPQRAREHASSWDSFSTQYSIRLDVGFDEIEREDQLEVATTSATRGRDFARANPSKARTTSVRNKRVLHLTRGHGHACDLTPNVVIPSEPHEMFFETGVPSKRQSHLFRLPFRRFRERVSSQNKILPWKT